MIEPEYRERWVIRVDDKDFITDKAGKDKVIMAMQNNKRFVALSEKDIISVRHISYIFLNSREIKKQLQAPERKEEVYTAEDRKKALKKIREIKKKYGIK